MEKTFDAKAVEQNIYRRWEESGCFSPSWKEGAKPYCIMLPPPNVTGSLHMGHAFQQTIMDILIRHHRMMGDNTLWQAGTDHAGIATQMVVERKLAAEEGKTRRDLGRDAFIRKVWDWKAESGGTITRQMRRLGDSVDWTRERFTMDDGLSRAVQEVFIRLYREDLIYRGKRLVNWDPKLRTAISDLEVENREVKSHMWHLRYPLADGAKTREGLDYLVVATTRPETMLGDTAVAVNPRDPRYQDLIGKKILLPLVNRLIPVVGDEHADMEKGTGCVKITPAHDFNDNEVGHRCGLPMINVLTEDARIRDEAQVFNVNGEPSDVYSGEIPEDLRGLDRYEARKAVLAKMENLGLLDRIEDHTLMQPYGDRGGVPIEPMLTDQWYVRAGILAEPAIKAVEDGRITFVPRQYENMYFSWMRNIQDWCISRQLWWGHRIPAWYDPEGNVYVGAGEEDVRSHYNLSPDLPLKQDEDVLDTWFSSALWTFSTLGWPEETRELKTFHPTDVLVTGFDIIFFWVARMIMMTMHFMKDGQGNPQVPFRTVYVTGLIRDEEGQKMSKSKGNVLDPLDMIDGISLDALVGKRTGNMMQPQMAEKIAKRTRKQFPEGIDAHGTDALRFTLAALASTGRDINWDMKRLEGYRNFCNKLWNASRYALMNAGDTPVTRPDPADLTAADRWIVTRLQIAIREITESFAAYRFDLAATTLYEFVWNEYCDWYLEMTKPAIWKGSPREKNAAVHTVLSVLEQILRLAHPIIPFITEEIWGNVAPLILEGHTGSETLMLQPYPKAQSTLEDQKALTQVEFVKQVVIGVRNIRAEMKVSPSARFSILLKAEGADAQAAEDNKAFIMALANVDDVRILPEGAERPLSVTKLLGASELLVPMAGLIDKDAELARLQKEAEKLQGEKDRIAAKLANESFVARAPQQVVDKERARLAEVEDQISKITRQREEIAAL